MISANNNPITNGTILIIVAGLSAILAALALSFLLRMRNDGEESALLIRDGQARIMLMAACSYVQECSRLGYDRIPSASAASGPQPAHVEAFGWIDVRDGSIGPRDQAESPLFDTAMAEDSDGNGSLDRPAWPAVDSVTRCVMAVPAITPYAVQLTTTYNPIDTAIGSAECGLPLLKHADPQAVATTWAAFITGDPTPRSHSLGMSWFRAFRDGPATFVVTCGAGGTMGFRDWNEVRSTRSDAGHPGSHADIFSNDPGMFEDLASSETRTWYRISWNAAVTDPISYNINIQNHMGKDNYSLYPMNASEYIAAGAGSARTQLHTSNMVGTISWVQRLRDPPSRW